MSPTRTRRRTRHRTRLPTGALLAGAAVLVVLGFALAVRGIGGDGPGGADGRPGLDAPLAVYERLLDRFDHPVVRRSDVPGRLDPTGTVVLVAGSPPDAPTAAHLDRFVRDGGRLVVTGADPTAGPDPAGGGPRWSGAGLAEWRAAPDDPGPARRVVAAGNGAWEDPGAGEAWFGAPSRALVVEAAVGAGTVLRLADPSPLANGRIAEADNAAFALALTGGPDRPVTLVLTPRAAPVDGAGDAAPPSGSPAGPTGIGALPDRWQVAVWLLLLGGLVLLWARSRRLGPPERRARALAPARRAHVDAVAALLARSGDPGRAVAPVVTEARQRLEELAGPARTHDRDALERTGRDLGLTDAEVAALFEPVTVDDEVLAAGRALAKLRSATAVTLPAATAAVRGATDADPTEEHQT